MRNVHPNDLPPRRSAICLAKEEYSQVCALYETREGEIVFEFWPGSRPDRLFYNRAGTVFGIPDEAWFWVDRENSPLPNGVKLFWGAPAELSEPPQPSVGLLEMFSA